MCARLSELLVANLEVGAVNEVIVGLWASLAVPGQLDTELFLIAGVLAEMTCHGSLRFLPTLVPMVTEE